MPLPSSRLMVKDLYTPLGGGEVAARGEIEEIHKLRVLSPSIHRYSLIGRLFYAMNTQRMKSLKELPVLGVFERRIYRLFDY